MHGGPGQMCIRDSQDGVLVGIITNRDMRFMEGSDFDQPIKNVMTKDNLVTAPVGTTLKEAQEILRRHRIEKLPLVDQEMHLKGCLLYTSPALTWAPSLTT